MTCQHSALYVRDTVRGMVPWETCPLCVEVERDALAARGAELERALSRVRDLADTALSVSDPDEVLALLDKIGRVSDNTLRAPDSAPALANKNLPGAG